MHLLGNLNTYIGKELGHTSYVRNRELEFSSEPIPRQKLIQNVKNTIEIIATTKATGKMKADLERPIDPENHLTLEIIENNQLVKTLRVENPLNKVVEYLNENNQYVSKQVTADEGEFFIRIQKKAGQSKIRVLETLNGNTKNELQTFNL